LILSLLFLFSFTGAVSAKTVGVVKAAAASPTPTPVPVINSFELFWPMSAGKTMQSKIYFLKILKENVRSFFIFGSAQKSDNYIFLATKRMLETEVLIKGNVTDLANKTLDSAASNLDKANSNLTNAKNSGDIDQGIKDKVNNRISNLKRFTNSLMSQYPNYKDKLQSISSKLNSLTL